MNNTTTFIPFSSVEIDSARKLAIAIDPDNSQDASLNNQTVNFAIFDSMILPHALKEQNFYQCTFTKVPFTGIDSSNIVLRDCSIDECKISNSNLKFSDFTGSKLHIIGMASSFDSSDFSSVVLHDSYLEGCSLQDSYFHNAKLLNSKFVQSEFVAVAFLQASFENLDISRSNLDYAEFEQVAFNNVIFPYWGTLHITKGLQEIMSGHKVWFSTPDGTHRVKNDQYIEEILALAPFFYHKKDFLALANIYILGGENIKAYNAIMDGINDACIHGRLRVLRHLCRMASLNSFFSRTQMRKLYQLVETALSNTALTPMKYKNYFQELDLAKRRLIDCPFDLDTMNITVQTAIPSSGYQKLSSVLKMIDTLISTAAPTAISHTEVRHNSPIEITVQISGLLKELILFYALLNFLFDKSTTYIERVQNIILNTRKIKKDNAEQSEIEQLQEQIAEIEKMVHSLEDQPTHTNFFLLLPESEDLQSISYTLSTKHCLPEELRMHGTSKK